MESRSPSPELAGGDGHAKHRDRGLGGQHARQVGCAAGAGDDGAQTAIARTGGIFKQEIRGAMGGYDARFIGHAVLLEDAGGGLHHGPVRVGAHYQADHGGRHYGFLGCQTFAACYKSRGIWLNISRLCPSQRVVSGPDGRGG